MRGGFEYLLILHDLLGREAVDVLPRIGGQKAGGRVETVPRVRALDVDTDFAGGEHFGVDDLGIVVESQKGIHHGAHLASIIARR